MTVATKDWYILCENTWEIPYADLAILEMGFFLVKVSDYANPRQKKINDSLSAAWSVSGASSCFSLTIGDSVKRYDPQNCCCQGSGHRTLSSTKIPASRHVQMARSIASSADDTTATADIKLMGKSGFIG